MSCEGIQNEEEKRRCILIQNRQTALRAVDMPPIPGLNPKASLHHARAVEHRDLAIAELDKAGEALARS